MPVNKTKQKRSLSSELLESRRLMSANLLTPTNFVVHPATSSGAQLSMSWTDPNYAAGVDGSTYTFAILEGSSPTSFGIFFLSSKALDFTGQVPGANDSITFPGYSPPPAGSTEYFGVQAYYPGNIGKIGINQPTAEQSGIDEFVLNTPQPAPVLSATPVENSIQLSWTADTGASSYTLSNATTSQVITTTTATNFTDTNTVYGQPKSYQVVANFNGTGGVVTQSLPSNIQTAVTVPDNTPLNYSGGFASAGNAIIYSGGVNATPYVSGNNIVFTDTNPINYSPNFYASDQLLTATAAEQVNTSQFDTTFTVQIIGNTYLGDTFGFQIGSVQVPFNFGIANSTNTLPHLNTTGLDNGAQSSSVDMTSSGVSLSSNDPLQVHLKYDGVTLSESVTDLTTNANFIAQYPTNIPATDGPLAQVGFYALTGAQEIIPPSKVEIDMLAELESWTYNPTPAPSVTTRLGGTPIGTPGGWTAGSTVSAAFDGKLNTYFDPANGNLSNWAGLDLGTATSITQIAFAPRKGYEFRMFGGQFQVSSTPDFSSDVHTIYTINSIPTASKLTTVAVTPGGAYRYIRYTGGTQWVNIAEMQVFGPGVVKTGTPISVGGAWLPNSAASAAFDGNLSTYFDPANGNLTNWVGLDLGTPTVVTQIKFAPRAGFEFRMYGGEFQASNTADFSSGVVTLYQVSAIPPSNQLTSVSVNRTNTAYRYYRYIGGTQWVNIAEMELDGV